jgi:hypothetical protein
MKKGQKKKYIKTGILSDFFMAKKDALQSGPI